MVRHFSASALILGVALFTTMWARVASAEDSLELGTASIHLSGEIAPKWRLSAFHSEVLDGSGTNFSTLGLTYSGERYAYQYELVNLRREPMAEVPNPKDSRFRAAISQRDKWRGINIEKKLRAEYRDTNAGDNWRARYGMTFSSKLPFGTHGVIPSATVEAFYDINRERFTLHLFNAGITYPLTDRMGITPGYLWVIVPNNTDIEYFTFTVSHRLGG